MLTRENLNQNNRTCMSKIQYAAVILYTLLYSGDNVKHYEYPFMKHLTGTNSKH